MHCIYSISIFGLVSKNEYIWYSYSVRPLGTNLFDIRIRSGCKKRIYSIFVFGYLDMNIFDIRIRGNFLLRIYLYSVKNLIFMLHWQMNRLKSTHQKFYGRIKIKDVCTSSRFIFPNLGMISSLSMNKNHKQSINTLKMPKMICACVISPISGLFPLQYLCWKVLCIADQNNDQQIKIWVNISIVKMFWVWVLLLFWSGIRDWVGG